MRRKAFVRTQDGIFFRGKVPGRFAPHQKKAGKAIVQGARLLSLCYISNCGLICSKPNPRTYCSGTITASSILLDWPQLIVDSADDEAALMSNFVAVEGHWPTRSSHHSILYRWCVLIDWRRVSFSKMKKASQEIALLGFHSFFSPFFARYHQQWWASLLLLFSDERVAAPAPTG